MRRKRNRPSLRRTPQRQSARANGAVSDPPTAAQLARDYHEDIGALLSGCNKRKRINMARRARSPTAPSFNAYALSEAPTSLNTDLWIRARTNYVTSGRIKTIRSQFRFRPLGFCGLTPHAPWPESAPIPPALLPNLTWQGPEVFFWVDLERMLLTSTGVTRTSR